MNDVFDAPPPNFTNQSKPPNPETTSLNFNPISSNSPVFDKPVYDDDYKGGGEDIFDGVFGIKTNSSSAVPTKKDSSGFDDFDLFGNFDVGKMEVDGKSKDRSSKKKRGDVDSDFSAFDDLMPGFGATNPSTNRETTETGQPQRACVPSTISTSNVIEESFVVSPTDSYPSHASAMLFTEPLEQIDAHSHPRNRKIDVSSVHGEISDGIHATSKGLFSSYVNNKENDEIHLGTNPYRTNNLVIKEPTRKSSIKISENVSEQKIPASNFREFHQSLFEMPFVSSASDHAFTQNGRHMNASSTETGSHMGGSLNSEDDSEASDEVWLTIKDITLTTLPTRAPPPSRSPPRPQHTTKVVKGYPVQSKDNDVFSSFYHSGQSNWIPQSVHDTVKSSNVPSIDELEDFARDRPQDFANGHDDVLSDEVAENSAAEASAAVKAVMDRAEAKFKQAREVWERKYAAKNGGSQQERDDKIMQDIQKREKQESIECEIEQREKDEKDREERKMEKERAQAQEIEKKREREKGRQAVDRAMKEVRDRAAVEARQKAERAAVDKVNAGARERAERAAVQKAQAEARERAATVARERAAKAASEALEMKNAEDKAKAAAVARAETEARTRADRAFVNRATAEARERAASAATRRNQQKSEIDFDSTFNESARSDNASSASSSDSAFDAQLHNNRHMPEKSVHSTSSGTRNASSTRNGVDDFTSFFGATPQSEDLQEVLSESDERRKARLERDQRMQERSDKALADKHERDRHTQWEQAERHRMAESLDFEIKRWAAGKEGNLRALLSTLQYVLWPECGWQPVSIADLITSASVKKVYRKATLCIHPDKVQQKGANLQQKYIAEKVFDLLKEAWNKLNSQELS